MTSPAAFLESFERWDNILLKPSKASLKRFLRSVVMSSSPDQSRTRGIFRKCNHKRVQTRTTIETSDIIRRTRLIQPSASAVQNKMFGAGKRSVDNIRKEVHGYK